MNVIQRHRILLISIVFLGVWKSIDAIPKEARMKDFVDLSEIDPTIRSSLRYLTSENFLGTPVRGYKNNVVMLTRPAAEALKRVQEAVKKDGYSLVVYDAYRPQTAVDHFAEWGKNPNDVLKKDYYYPYVSKEEVFQQGYVAKRSGHSAGSVVDITIIEVDKKIHPVKAAKRTLTDGTEVYFLDDGTVDMGTSFDFFGKASHSGTNLLVSPQANKMRDYLATKMAEGGFEVLPTEWWHFRLKEELEPHRGQFFDFPIED